VPLRGDESVFRRVARQRFWLSIMALAFVSTSSGQNLVWNPGFELGTSGWQSYSGWAPMTTTTNFPHSGARAALVYNRPNTYAGPSQSLLGILQAGQTYICSGWTRVERGDNQPTQLSMRQIDGAGTRWIGLAHGVAYSNRWTFISGTFTLNVVGTLTDLTLYFEDPAAGVDYLIDDVSVFRLPSVAIAAPTDGSAFLAGSDMLVTAEAISLPTARSGRWISIRTTSSLAPTPTPPTASSWAMRRWMELPLRCGYRQHQPDRNLRRGERLGGRSGRDHHIADRRHDVLEHQSHHGQTPSPCCRPVP